MLQRITSQERLASYMKKMLQRSRNVFQVTWRRYHNVPGTSCKLIEEDVTTYHVSGTSCKLVEEAFTTYQEHITQATWNKMWQGSRIVLYVTWRSCSNVSRIRNALHVTWRRGTSCKLLDEDVATYQECLASYLKKSVKKYQERLASYFQKMLQRRFWGGPFRSRPCSIPAPDPDHSWLPVVS